jgi:WS/DGAT/MGAT family acyltransferase
VSEIAELSVAEDMNEPLSSVDHAWLRMDEPTNLMVINGVLALDQPMDFERLQSVFAERLVVLPRFRQKVVANGGRPRWTEDKEFDLSKHLLRVALPAPGGAAELRDLINSLISAPLDPGRPLWIFYCIDNYNGGSVLFGQLHHAIGDGVALMLVLLSLTDLSPDPDPGHPPNPFTAMLRGRSKEGLQKAREVAEEVMPDGMKLLLNPVEALRKTGRWLKGLASVGALGRLVLRPADPLTLFKGHLVVEKRVAWSDAIPVEDVKVIGKALGGTINDVLVTAVAGGLRRYLESRGHPASASLNFRAAMPVNLRPLEKMSDLGNQFGLIFLSLPVGILDPIHRLAVLRKRATSLKRSTEPVVVYGILRAMGLSPYIIQKIVVRIFATKATAVMTNIPGPRQTIYLAGKPIRDLFFWVPQSGRVGLGVSICSYAGHIRLGVGTDAGLVPDPEEIVQGFHEEVAELKRLAAAGARAAA